MRLLYVFARSYPPRTMLSLAALLIAGVAEGLGLTPTLGTLVAIVVGGLLIKAALMMWARLQDVVARLLRAGRVNLPASDGTAGESPP